MATNAKRTIKISEEVYKALSHQSEKEKKPMEEIASALLTKGLASSDFTYGEQYDPRTGKRIFRT